MTFQTPSSLVQQGTITGQLFVKSLLSILKHKAVEKTVDRCDLSIVEGGQETGPTNDFENEEENGLESKLIIRLYCKYGVVKTHRLLLSPTNLLAPHVASMGSRVTVGPRALKDILEHFPHARGTKSDPQLVWLFGINDVKIKSVFGGDNKGKSQISTEIKMSADEFDSYNICEPPISLAFHLREFNFYNQATIALAESLSVALDLRFSESAAPIYIEFDTDASDSDFLFIISTTHTMYDESLQPKPARAGSLYKHRRDDGSDESNSGSHMARASKRKSLPVTVRASSSMTSQATSSRDIHTGNNALFQDSAGGDVPVLEVPEARNGPTPLFMLGASQLSNADLDIIRESGLGIEHMNYDEFEAMMEADGEEVGETIAVENELDKGENANDQEGSGSSLEHDFMGPSQAPVGRKGDRIFRPLFDD